MDINEKLRSLTADLKVGDYFVDDEGNKWTVVSTPENKVPKSENDVLAHHIIVIPADLNKEPFAVYALGSNIRRAEAIKQASLDRFNTGFCCSFAYRSMLKDAEKVLARLRIVGHS